jgi:hypothetical protein
VKWFLVLLTLMNLLLAACGGILTPTFDTTIELAASATPVTMETYSEGEPVAFLVDDTVWDCDDDLPCGIVQITGSGEHPVRL